MTARELLAKLQVLVDAEPLAAERLVAIEGCDCYGHAEDVEVRLTDPAGGIEGGHRTILISRWCGR
jgi:hypothetical protein